MSQVAFRITTLPGEGTVMSVSGGNNITITGDPTVDPIVNVSGTTNHSVLLGNATGSINSLPNGTTGQILTAVTGADPIWGSAPGTGTVTSLTAATGITLTPNPITTVGTIGLTIPVVVSSGGTGQITNTNHGVLLGQGSSPIVATAVGSTNTVLLGNTAADPSFGQVPNAALTNSSVTLNSGNNITVTGGGPLALGGVASFDVTGTTQNAVQIGSAAGALSSVAVGATNTVLLGNTAAAPTFGQVPNAALANSSITLTNGNNITITGSPVALGGAATVNVSGNTNNSLLYGNGTGSISSLGVATNGQIPIGSTGATPVLGTITAGANITVTNGAGAITIAASIGSGTVSSLSASTGITLTPSPITTTGSIALTVPVVVSSGGTGATTLTGLVLGNGTSAMTAITYIPTTSFTPVLSFGGSSTGITYTTQTGSYSRIGDVITFNIAIDLTSKGSATGNMSVSAPTFTSTNNALFPLIYNGLTYTGNQLGARYLSSAFIIFSDTSATGAATLTNTAFANTTNFTISGSMLAV